METLCGDSFWNISLSWNTKTPNFTLCFQTTALYWIPSAFFMLLTLNDVYTLQKKTTFYSIGLNRLNVSRLSLTLCNFILCFIETIALYQMYQYFSSIISPLLRSCTMLWALWLINYHRIKGVHNSGIFFVFWLILLLCGSVPLYVSIVAPETYSLFYITVFYVQYIIWIFQVLLSLFSERVPYPNHSSNRQHPKPCPSSRVSFISAITYNWLTPLMWLGFRKTLVSSDLWALPSEFTTKYVDRTFDHVWKKEVTKCKATNFQRKKFNNRVIGPEIEQGLIPNVIDVNVTRPSLLKVLFKISWLPLFKAQLCKLVCDVLQFCNPLVLKALIKFTSSTEETWHGYFYVVMFFTISILYSVLFHKLFYIGAAEGMKIKSALISALFKKSLTISGEERKKATTGKILNYMSTDCERLYQLVMYLWIFWSAPLQITIALVMLYNEIGYSVFMGLAALILSMPLNAVFTALQKRYQAKQLEVKDSRIKNMNEVLNGIKVLKLFTWELPYQDLITNIRNKELKYLKKNAVLSGITTFIFSLSPFLVMLASFFSYIYIEKKQLTATKTFVTLSLFNIIRVPIMLLPLILSIFVQGMISLKRINKYLSYKDMESSIITNFPDIENSISVNHGCFSWGENSTFSIESICTSIAHGSLTAIVGPVGSGKSSLIQAILGDMAKRSGTINVCGDISYVAQHAWIQNLTVKDNILFGKKFKETKYRKVVEACSLLSDFQMLQHGDATEIGEKGITLSGGQKQRVSLARAVYHNSDIYLLDDPLSAVDSHVGKHLFDKVIGPNGILRSKTRLLVTHALQWLSQCDQILFMANGVIVCQGSYNELLQNSSFREYIHTTSEITNDSNFSDFTSDHNNQFSIYEEMENSLTISNLEASTGMIPSIMQSDTRTGKPLRYRNAEVSQTGSVSYRVFFKYIHLIGYFSFFLSIGFITIYQLLAMFASIWLSKWTDDPLLSNPNSNPNWTNFTQTENTYLSVYASLGLLQGIFMLIASTTLSVSLILASGRLHKSLLTAIMKSPMSFFDTTPIGRILNRFSRDTDVMDNALPNTFIQFVTTLYSVGATILVIMYAVPAFAIFILPMLVAYYFLQRFYIKTSRQLKRIESTTRSPIFNHFSEILTGIATVRAYREQNRFIRENQSRVDENNIFILSGVLAARWLGVRINLIGSLIVAITSLLAVISRGSSAIGSGLVGLSVSYALTVTNALNWLVRMASELETNIIAAERLMEYAQLPPEADWHVNKQISPDWPEKGVVKFTNFSSRYREGLDLVLRKVSFETNPGEKIGIVGRTGAGKSSLTMGLFRMIESAGGSIHLDGIDISTLGLHQLRSRITILPQDPTLFSGTLRSNLDRFDLHDDEALWVALGHAHLKEFVMSTKGKLNYDVGEGGSNLSVGQRQLVCLARSLLTKTKLLVLDEATAAVDMNTDELIQKTIRKEFRDCTVLTIAHRLNTVMDYDRVMVLRQGYIVEFDSPENLLQNPDGFFYGMAKDAELI